MSRAALLQRLMEGNARFAADGWDPADRTKSAVPSLALAVVACMDTRYTVERVLGLDHGDAKIVRTAGNVVDEGVLRSLTVAVHLLYVGHVAVLGHTQCGMVGLHHDGSGVARRLADATGRPAPEFRTPEFRRWLGGFADVEENVRQGCRTIRAHQLLPDDLDVFGLVYENETGRVRPVEPA